MATGILPEFFTEGEVAASLKKSKRCTQGWRLRGEGPPYIKLGSGARARIVYSAVDFAEWVAKQRRTSTAQRGAA